MRVVFLDNTVGRFFRLSIAGRLALGPLNDAYVAEKGKSPFFYIETLLALVQPWLMIFCAAIIALFRRKNTGELRMFLKVAFIAIPLILSLSTSKVSEYLMPLLFVLLLMAADFFHDLFLHLRRPARWERALLILNIALVGILLVLSPAVASVVFEYLQSDRKLGIVIGPEFYAKHKGRFDAIPHAMIQTPRGRKVFAFVYNNGQ